MADDILIPTADAVIIPVLEKIYEKRPSAFRHLNLRSGRYWHPVLGYRAQAARMLKRLALLATARRLKSSSGQELLDYVASEYETVPETDKTFAMGTLLLARDATLPLPGGVIPKGTRFTRTKFEVIGITFETADYETLTDIYVPADSTASIPVPIRALRPGAHANTPLYDGPGQATGITFPKIVENVSTLFFEAAGGCDGADDDFVRLFAKTFSKGQYGPTSDASKLGALSATGVRHFLVYDEVATGSQKILIADASWGSSARWAATVQQTMYDADLVGFGCKVSFGMIRNKVVAVEATVVLRDPNYLTETTEIDLAIQKAVRSYFDDRVDWNVWSEDGLRAAIARAHPKIFNCPSIAVKEFASGAAVSEILTPNFTTEQFHFLVSSNATKLSYLGPS